MKRLFLFFVAVLMMSSMLMAQTPDGLTCENAIPVDKSYEGEIPQAGTYYYRASTYDLPMTCYYYPTSSLNEVPQIKVDFTCTPGVYDDPNLDYIIQSASGWGIKTPIVFSLTRSFDEYNREVYSLTIDESYRELMTLFGITYDIEAIIQVDAPCAGKVQMSPDTTFRSCVENSEWLTLPDTIVTGVQHETDSYVLPFADWVNDSIRFRWTGTEAPVTIWMGEDCEFEFKTSGDNCALEMFVLNPDAGNGENVRDFSRAEIAQYISLFGHGGVYYLRTACAEDGQLIIEPKPMNEAMKDAIQLNLNTTVQVEAKATEQVYFFQTSWEDKSILWESTADCPVTAYFSNDVKFVADASDEHVFATYAFATADNGTELTLSKKQMKELCRGVSGDHVFVKFISAQPTNITPMLWGAGACIENTDEIYLRDSVTLQKNANTTAWRVNIHQWAKQDMMLYWKGTSTIKAFLCDTCKGFNLNKTNEHVKIYKEATINTDGSRDTIILTQEELLAAAEYADADGFMYFRFNNSAKGALIAKPYVRLDEINATPLVIDSTINIPIETVEETFYFTRDWTKQSVEFVTNSADSVVAYVATKADFDISAKEPQYIAAYPFFVKDNQRHLQISKFQFSELFENTSNDILYVIFYASNTVQITPIIWSACACVENSLELLANDKKNIPAYSQNTVYRVNYDLWKESDVTLHWAGTDTLWAYMATQCDFNMVATNMHVLNTEDVDILPNDTMVIGEEVRVKAIDNERLPEDGFLYFRFYSKKSGVLTTTAYRIDNTGIFSPTIKDTDKRRIICTPDGRIYILVGEERYTILGEKL